MITYISNFIYLSFLIIWQSYHTNTVSSSRFYFLEQTYSATLNLYSGCAIFCQRKKDYINGKKVGSEFTYLLNDPEFLTFLKNSTYNNLTNEFWLNAYMQNGSFYWINSKRHINSRFYKSGIITERIKSLTDSEISLMVEFNLTGKTPSYNLIADKITSFHRGLCKETQVQNYRYFKCSEDSTTKSVSLKSTTETKKMATSFSTGLQFQSQSVLYFNQTKYQNTYYKLVWNGITYASNSSLYEENLSTRQNTIGTELNEELISNEKVSTLIKNNELKHSIVWHQTTAIGWTTTLSSQENLMDLNTTIENEGSLTTEFYSDPNFSKMLTQKSNLKEIELLSSLGKERYFTNEIEIYEYEDLTTSDPTSNKIFTDKSILQGPTKGCNQICSNVTISTTCYLVYGLEDTNNLNKINLIEDIDCSVIGLTIYLNQT